jgi:hypothetical protein
MSRDERLVLMEGLAARMRDAGLPAPRRARD